VAWSTNSAWSHDLDEVFGTHRFARRLKGWANANGVPAQRPGTGRGGCAGRACITSQIRSTHAAITRLAGPLSG